MVGGLILALLFATQGKTGHRPPDLNNAQLSIRYLRQEPYGGMPRYGSDTAPYLITQTFEPYKGPPTNDPGDTKPLTFTLEKPGKDGWKYTGKSDDQTMEVLADANVAIAYQRWEHNGFTVLNAKTGTKMWSHKPTARGKHVGIALHDGVLYLWEKGLFTALNPATGTPIWSQPLEADKEDFEVPPIRIKEGRIFIALLVKDRAHLYCLDARTGEKIWNRDVGFKIKDFAVTTKRVVTYQDIRKRETQDPIMTMVCLDAGSGVQIWNIPVDRAACLYEPEATDDVVFLPGCRSPSFLYKLSDGSLIKKFDMIVSTTLFGPYVLEIDDSDGLRIILAETGERIGRIQLAKDEIWEFHAVQDRLLILYSKTSTWPHTNQVYEISRSK